MCIVVEGKRSSGKAVWLIVLFWIRYVFVMCSNGVCRVCVFAHVCVCVRACNTCTRVGLSILYMAQHACSFVLFLNHLSKGCHIQKKPMFVLYLICSAEAVRFPAVLCSQTISPSELDDSNVYSVQDGSSDCLLLFHADAPNLLINGKGIPHEIIKLFKQFPSHYIINCECIWIKNLNPQ